MGRYYSGDIEGKFWFGVQSSTDGEFFGMVENTSFVDYYIDEADINVIEEGLKKCKRQLRGHLTKMNKFYRGDSFSRDSLGEVLDVDDDYAHDLTVWYARLELGKKIHECVLEEGCCYMNAEM